MHESGKTLYPGTGFESETGRGPGEGFTVNLPLPAGTFDEAYVHAFREVALPILRAYQPGALVVEFGMDTLAGDPLTHLALTNQAHVELIPLILSLGVPTLVTGGGGYHVENTLRGWTLAWKTFSGQADEHDWGFGLGGVMLESTEWSGGLIDRFRPVTDEQRRAVVPPLEQTLADLRARFFPRFGLKVP
jgi:acetoin utilization protein AcuC